MDGIFLKGQLHHSWEGNQLTVWERAVVQGLYSIPGPEDVGLVSHCHIYPSCYVISLSDLTFAAD